MHSHTVYRDRDAMARNAAHERIPRVPKSEGKGKASSSSDKDKDGKEKEKDEPTTIMTYCYGEQRVYVSHTHDYDTALSLAFQEFPEFDPTGPERMQFSIAVRVKTGDARVRVSRSAWPNVAAQMRQWEVVYVNQLPVGAPVPRSPYPPLKELELEHQNFEHEEGGEREKEGAGVEGLPKYEPPAEGSQFLTVDADEKASSRPRTASHSRSPTHSRPASTHSRASSRERSPGLGDRVKNWFKNDSD